MSKGDTYAVVNKHNQKSPSVTRKANERGKKAPRLEEEPGYTYLGNHPVPSGAMRLTEIKNAPRLEEEPGYAYVGNHPVPSGAMRLTEIKNDVVIEEDSAYANVQACLSSPGDTNIMENREVAQEITSTTKKSMTLRSWRGVFILMAAVILAIVVSFSALILQLSRQPELNNNEVLLLNSKLRQSEDKITSMGRNQTGLQILIKQAENKITAMGKNQTSLQILLQKSEDMITAMGKNQMSLQMLLKQAEEKLTVMTRTQSTLQIQLKQAEFDITSVKTKQSSLETKVSQAEQKITALQWNHGQKDIQSKCCPRQWQKFEHSCYFLTTFAGSWQNGKMHCQGQSSTLVVINSAGEQDFLRQNVEDLNRKLNQQLWYWIGLTDTEVEGKWKWVDGTLCDCRNNTNSYWYVGRNVREPDNWNNNEDCVLMRGDGRWGDKNCDDNRSWICEKQTERCPP